MTDPTFMEQLTELARQVGQFAVSNAQPSAELAGRVVQMKAIGALSVLVLAGVAIILAWIISFSFSRQGDAETDPKKKEDADWAAGTIGLIALITTPIWAAAGALWVPTLIYAVCDWRFALAAKVMGAL